MIDISYIKNREQILPVYLTEIQSWMGDKEVNKSLSYKRWQDRQAYLLGRLLLVQFIKQHNYNYSLLKKISYTKFNRPFIEGVSFDFNISHSGEYIVCAFSVNQVVGIDIEYIHPIDLNDFTYILSETEKEQIENAEDKLLSFFKTWSAKEAILKAQGSGLIDDLERLEINNNGVGSYNKQSFYYKHINISPFYSSVIASLTPVKIGNIKELTVDVCFGG